RRLTRSSLRTSASCSSEHRKPNPTSPALCGKTNTRTDSDRLIGGRPVAAQTGCPPLTILLPNRARQPRVPSAFPLVLAVRWVGWVAPVTQKVLRTSTHPVRSRPQSWDAVRCRFVVQNG